MKWFGVLFFLLVAAGCQELPTGQARIDQLCQHGCQQAVVAEEAPFDPDQNVGRLPEKCDYGTSTTLAAGTVVSVVKVMPEGFYGDWALVAFLDSDGNAIIGWLDEDFLEPNPRNDVMEHCSTP